jgi:hypothetical protein
MEIGRRVAAVMVLSLESAALHASPAHLALGQWLGHVLHHEADWQALGGLSALGEFLFWWAQLDWLLGTVESPSLEGQYAEALGLGGFQAPWGSTCPLLPRQRSQ